MAERKPATKGTQRSAKSTTATSKASKGFTAEERAAMKERARELKAEARASGQGGRRTRRSREDRRVAGTGSRHGRAASCHHHGQRATLSPKTWYGMPAYAKDGKVVCYFTPAQKFNERYATFGFNDAANLDEGNMWPTSFALKKLTPAEEKKMPRS